MIAIYLSKQKAFDADTKAIQQINFTGNLDGVGNATFFCYWSVEEGKVILDFSQGNVKVFQIYFVLI